MLTFAVLAACFEEMEHTSSRRQLTTLLAELLANVDADEIAEVTYLIQGRVERPSVKRSTSIRPKSAGATL